MSKPAFNSILSLLLALLLTTIFSTNLHAATVTPISAGTYPDAVGVNPVTNKIYAMNYSGGYVTVINGVDGSIINPALFTSGWGGMSGFQPGSGPYYSPSAIAVNPITNRIYIAHYGSNNVTVINGATDTVIGSGITVGTSPMAIAVNTETNKIYVANNVSGTVSVIDGGLGYVTNTITVGSNPRGLAVNPFTNLIYVANWGSNSVSVIDGSTDTVTATVTGVFSNPERVAVNPVTNKIYVGVRSASNITIINGNDNTITTTSGAPLSGFGYAVAVAVNPVTNMIYIADAAPTGRVAAINGADGTQLATAITVNSTPAALAVNPVTNTLYVGNQNSPYLNSIDLAAWTSTTSTSITGSSWSVAVNPTTNSVYSGNYSYSLVNALKEVTTPPIPLTTTITPFPGDTTANSSPTYDFTTTTGVNWPAIRNVYYQVDSTSGVWQKAGIIGTNQYRITPTTPPLTTGSHTIYAFATDGQDSTSVNTGNGASPLIGAMGAYTFTVGTVSPITDGTLTATGGNNQVTLSWTPASSGAGIASYRLAWDINGGLFIPDCAGGKDIGNVTSYTHEPLINGQTYYYRVCAVDNVLNVSTGATAFAASAAQTLTITKTGSGTGTVKSQVTGIDCGTVLCSASMDRVVTLTAQPDAGSYFAGSSGACVSSALSCTLTMDMAKTVTANFTTTAPTLVPTWNKTFGGPGPESANAIRQTADGGSIVAGAKNYAGYILKLSPTGTVVWQNSYANSASDVINDIQQTADNGYITAGQSSNDAWIMKLGADGSIIWQFTYGGTGFDSAKSIQQTADGGYIFTGTFDPGTYNYTDIWVVKLDSSGNIVWENSYGGSGIDGGTTIRQTSNGQYMVSGYYDESTYLYRPFLMLLNSDGSIAWSKYFGVTGQFNSVEQTRDGNFIAAGTNGINAWLVRLNSDNNIAWSRTFNYLGGYQPASAIVEALDGSFTAASGGMLLNISADGTTSNWQRDFAFKTSDKISAVVPAADGGFLAVGTSGFDPETDFWLTKTDSSGAVNGWTKPTSAPAPADGGAVTFINTTSTISTATTTSSKTLSNTTPQKYVTLNINNIGTGSGLVTATSPTDTVRPSIDCGRLCTSIYLSGTLLNLNATPFSSSTFDGATGAIVNGVTATSGTMTITADTTLTATFTNHGDTLLLNETFDSTMMPSGWSVATSQSSPWTLFGGASVPTTLNSVRGGGGLISAGATSITTLTSPIINLSGYTSAELVFKTAGGGGTAMVETSLDGGTTWGTAFSTTLPFLIGSTTQKVSIISGSSTTLIRFNYNGMDSGNWEIDDVQLYASTAIPQANIFVSPTSHNFGTIPVNGSASWPITITNNGTAPLSVTDISITGSENSINSTVGLNACNSLTPVIAAGSSCNLTLTVAPLTPGFKGGTVTITSNAANMAILPVNFSAKTDPQNIAYIYDTDTVMRDEFSAFLSGLGYTVTPVQLLAAETYNFGMTDLILIGHDTSGALTSPYNGSNWGTATAVGNINSSNRPILGLGFGGASLFSNLGLYIDWGHGWTGSDQSIFIVNSTNPIFNAPRLVSGYPVSLYTVAPAEIGIDMPTAQPGVTPLGMESTDLTYSHYSLIQQKTANQVYTLWGFGGSPATMSTDGQNLFSNILFSLAPTPMPPAPCTPPPTGMVSWWKGENSTSDQIGTNPASFSTTSMYVTGKSGQAFSFDGVTALQSGTIGMPVGSSDRTISLWAKINQADTTYSFFAGYGTPGTNDQAYQLGAITANNNQLFFSNWGGQILGPNLQTGRWYHVAVTTTGGFTTLFLDGVPVGTSSTLTINTPVSTQFVAGYLDSSRYLKGGLDEIQVYNRALTAAEIQSIYNSGSNGVCLLTKIKISPASYNFNTVPVGGFATWPVSITNNGSTPLNVSSISIAGSGYSMDPNAGTPPCGTAPTLTAGNSCQLSVKIAPTVTGNFTGTLTVVSDDPVMPFATATFSAVAIAPPPSNSVSGTIAYSGGKTGRIYVSLQGMNGNNLGTSIDFPTETTYTIRGVQPGSNTVNAFMDHLNLGTWVQTSPNGNTPVNISTVSVTGANITLTDPSPVAPPAPMSVSGSAGDSAVILDWEKPRNNSIESADSYDIYWGTTAALSKLNASGSRLNFPAGADSPAVIDGLTNGTILYFIVIPKSGGVEGTASLPFGPLTVGAPTAGHIVSGTVNYSGPTATGPLYVAIVDPSNKGAGKIFFTKILNPTATQNFTVSGVADGSYEIFSIIDMNNDKIFGSGDVMDSRFSSPKVKLSGADVTGIIINLSAANADTTITTMHMKQGIAAPIESYNVESEVQGQLKIPVKVTLTAAPAAMGLSMPIDIALSKEGRKFNFSQFSPTRPVVGDQFQFSITYDDTTTDSAVTATVTGVNDYFPTNPMVTTSNVPTFSWSAPTPAPSGYYSYSVWVNGTVGNFFWDSADLPDSTTSIVYGANGSIAPQLSIGTQYNWQVAAKDQNGNSAAVGNSFTPGTRGTPLIFWSNPADITYGTPLSAQQLNATSQIGGTFAYTPDFATVPAAGTEVLSVIFTPANITSYSTATATVTLNVLKAPQVITFGTAPTLTYGGVTADVSATGGASGTAVTFSSLTTGVCTISGSTVTPVSAGTCTIAADQAGDLNYLPAVQATQSFTIAQAAQTAAVSNTPQTYTGSPMAATVTCLSGGTATSILTGGVATQTNAGSYTVTADCPASTNYTAVTAYAAGNFVISPATPTVSITNSPTTYSGLAQTATVACLGGGAATLASGGTGTNAGSYPATVNCAPSANYAAASGITAGSFVISPATPTVSITNSPTTYS
ncbi:MAG: choice-of-anchor D domain-containing protein, partial [Geobacteraceae bacterium]|nr:choice-of-anchor D domain-containing protein [Geobacteraceae bacterium]